VVESFYYAYRITGSRVYQDVSLLISSLNGETNLLSKWAWNAFKAINATTRVGSGFSEITDVNAPNGGSFNNFQDSFLFAEVMKYRYDVSYNTLEDVANAPWCSYLIHAPDAEWQVNHDGVNEFVFNTGTFDSTLFDAIR
jgi:mannosyl-oligosaccharide alpha-1,2-mannosidase